MKKPGAVLARAWKMSDETKKWVTFNHTSNNPAPLLKQSAEAEENELLRLNAWMLL
ncbi:MAG: hypothetical protein WC502_02610 [Methanolinea sp.]|jgi:hypothetical protein|nr:hypothetical protein [Methanolinea sp.]